MRRRAFEIVVCSYYGDHKENDLRAALHRLNELGEQGWVVVSCVYEREIIWTLECSEEPGLR